MKVLDPLPLDPETQFFCGLLELQYGEADVKKMQKLASQVPWARGWPARKEAFWNGEAFLWKKKIDAQKRELIRKEIISFFGEKKKAAKEISIMQKESNQNESNLDLGCGAYSYIPSVGLDCSQEMLKLNEQCTKKVIGDIEKPLPFVTEKFSSVTAVFVLNYVEKYSLLFSEIFRVLKPYGRLVMVLAEKGVNDWQRQKETHNFSVEKWKIILEKQGFFVQRKVEQGLVFFLAKKKRGKVIK